MAIIYSSLWLVLMVVLWAWTKSHLWVFVLCMACSLLYSAYQARFLFARPLDRPSGYEVVSSVLFVFDLLAHLAVALACGIGPVGIATLVIGYFMSGRAARAFAEKRVRSEVRDRFERDAQDWSAEKRQQAADVIAARQIKGRGVGL